MLLMCDGRYDLLFFLFILQKKKTLFIFRRVSVVLILAVYLLV